MKAVFPYLFPAILFLSISCGNFSKRELKLLKVTELGSARISDSAIVRVVEHHTKWKIDISYHLSEDTALNKLWNREVDMAILPNNTPQDEAFEVKTVMPLLPRILLILTKNIPGLEYMELKQLLENHQIVFEDMSRLDSIFFKKLYFSNGIDPAKINAVSNHMVNIEEWYDSSFVYIGLTHLHNPVMEKLLDYGAEFFPLDDVADLGKGSAVEGLNLVFPHLYPFILPRSFYKDKPLKPVLTIAIPDILVTRTNMNENTVYEVVKTLVENKMHLIQYDNIYNLLDTDFRNRQYNFPMHDGTIKFLDRDKPSIWSRYASIIWPFVSMLAILIGALASVRKRMQQRKKMRIETLYFQLLKLREKILRLSSSREKDSLLHEIHGLRSKAFEALMNDKLVANESFSIFLSLYNEVLREVQEKELDQ